MKPIREKATLAFHPAPSVVQVFFPSRKGAAHFAARCEAVNLATTIHWPRAADPFVTVARK